jgi:hypothetical protein
VSWFLVALAFSTLGASGAEPGRLALSADLFGGTETTQGFGAGALWLFSCGTGGSCRAGANGVSLRDAQWAYASAGRSLEFHRRYLLDTAIALGRSDLPDQDSDYAQAAATFRVGVGSGRVGLLIGDQWMDIGDRAGQIAQGGVELLTSHRWSAQMRLFYGITGNLDEEFVNASVTIVLRSMTWTGGLTAGRMVPFAGAPPGLVQDSTEIYLSMGVPLGRQSLSVTGSRFGSPAAERRALSATWILPLPSATPAAESTTPGTESAQPATEAAGPAAEAAP